MKKSELKKIIRNIIKEGYSPPSSEYDTPSSDMFASGELAAVIAHQGFKEDTEGMDDIEAYKTVHSFVRKRGRSHISDETIDKIITIRILREMGRIK
jgi:hypothetical protein